MAESRRCGYCREVGHQVRHCVTKQGERELIKKFVYSEPLEIYKALCRAGFGEGAMLKIGDKLAQVLPYDTELTYSSWGNNRWKTTFLDSLIKDSTDLITYKKVKYSKQVVFKLNSPMPENDIRTADRYHSNGQYVYVDVPVLILKNGGQIERFRICPNGIFTYLRAEKDTSNPWKLNEYTVAAGKREYQRIMVEPSYECVPLVIPDKLRNIPDTTYLHERLQ